LNPGGGVYVNIPTWFSKTIWEFIAYKMFRKALEYEIEDHKMYYDKHTLWPLLRKAGFTPKNIKMAYHKFGMCLYAICKKKEGAI
jgi:hypothetical protein